MNSNKFIMISYNILYIYHISKNILPYIIMFYKD